MNEDPRFNFTVFKKKVLMCIMRKNTISNYLITAFCHSRILYTSKDDDSSIIASIIYKKKTIWTDNRC